MSTAPRAARGRLSAVAPLALLFALLAGWWLHRTREAPAPRPVVAAAPQQPTPAAPSSAAPAPPPPITPLVGAPAPDTARTPVALARLWDAAARYDGAPSLAELAHELVPTAAVRMTERDYLDRLADLAQLPAYVPLPIGMRPAGFDPAASIEAKLATAVAMLDPGNGLPGSAPLDAAIRAGPPRAGAAVALAQSWLAAGTRSFGCGDDAGIAVAKAKALGLVAVAADPAVAARAMALADPRCRPDTAPWRPAPSGRATAPRWFADLIALLVFAPFVPWIAATRARRKAYLRNRRPTSSPLRSALFDDLPHVAPDAPSYRRALSALQRRVARAGTELDVDGTVAASARASGRIVPVLQTTRRRPSYLVLIERLTRRDQQAALMGELVRPFARIVDTEVYAYQRDPAFVDPIDGGPALSIEELLASRPDHRVLVLGTGDGFHDVLSGAPTRAAARLARWAHRLLLSPRPATAWGGGEAALARALATQVGPATPAGLAALAPALAEPGGRLRPGASGAGDDGGAPLPPLLLRAARSGATGPEPEQEVRQATIAQVRGYLDAPGFEWLCALAVYPALDWSLTLYLGQALRADPTGDDPTPMLSWPRLAALTRLPWLREGRMPGWLRTALAREMGPQRSEEVRRLLLDLVSRGGPAVTGGAPRGPTVGQDAGAAGPPTSLDDEVLLDFLARGSVGAFAVPLPPPGQPHPQRNPFDRVGLFELALIPLGVGLALFGLGLAPGYRGALPPGPNIWVAIIALLLFAVLLPAATALGWRRWPAPEDEERRRRQTGWKLLAFIGVVLVAVGAAAGIARLARDDSRRLRAASDQPALLTTEGNRTAYVDADGRSIVLLSRTAAPLRLAAPGTAPVVALALAPGPAARDRIAAATRDGRVWWREGGRWRGDALLPGALAIRLAVTPRGLHVAYMTPDGSHLAWPIGGAAVTVGQVPVTAMRAVGGDVIAESNARGILFVTSGTSEGLTSGDPVGLPGGAVAIVPRRRAAAGPAFLAIGRDGTLVAAVADGPTLDTTLLGRRPALARGPVIAWPDAPARPPVTPVPGRTPSKVAVSVTPRIARAAPTLVAPPDVAAPIADDASLARAVVAMQATLTSKDADTKIVAAILAVLRTSKPPLSPASTAAFLAVSAYETAGYYLLQERLSGKGSPIGQTAPADTRFIGRGLFMHSGEVNYGRLAEIDPALAKDPSRLAQPEVAARVGLAWWRQEIDGIANRAGVVAAVDAALSDRAARAGVEANALRILVAERTGARPPEPKP